MVKPRYIVQIGPVQRARPEFWPGCNYSVSYRKTYGNSDSYSTCVATKEDILVVFRHMRSGWEGRDWILGRMGNPVTHSNLQLDDSLGVVAKEELLRA